MCLKNASFFFSGKRKLEEKIGQMKSTTFSQVFKALIIEGGVI